VGGLEGVGWSWRGVWWTGGVGCGGVAGVEGGGELLLLWGVGSVLRVWQGGGGWAPGSGWGRRLGGCVSGGGGALAEGGGGGFLWRGGGGGGGGGGGCGGGGGGGC